MPNTKCLSAMQSRARFQLCKAWPSSPFLFRKIETTFQISLNAQCPLLFSLGPFYGWAGSLSWNGLCSHIGVLIMMHWCWWSFQNLTHSLTHSVSDKVIYWNELDAVLGGLKCEFPLFCEKFAVYLQICNKSEQPSSVQLCRERGPRGLTSPPPSFL